MLYYSQSASWHPNMHSGSVNSQSFALISEVSFRMRAVAPDLYMALIRVDADLEAWVVTWAAARLGLVLPGCVALSIELQAGN